MKERKQKWEMLGRHMYLFVFIYIFLQDKGLLNTAGAEDFFFVFWGDLQQFSNFLSSIGISC